MDWMTLGLLWNEMDCIELDDIMIGMEWIKDLLDLDI